MKKLLPRVIAFTALLPALSVSARIYQPVDTASTRQVALIGDPTLESHRQNLLAMNMGFNSAFEDPAAPRFLFLDKEGRVAFGIGGSLKALAMYDMAGAINNNGFATYQIPVPFNPAQRERFGASATHSSIILKLVTAPTRFGRIIVFTQTEFTGGASGYGLELTQIYAQVGHFTLGKARTTFADGPAMAPTVDTQGPSGQVSPKNMMVEYTTPEYKGFSGAISVELPTASYTEAPHTEAIPQRVPDIPAYVQYAWDGGDSHVRLSGLFRELSYRDMLQGKNNLVVGWGVQLSAIAKIAGGLDFFGHYTYGKGIGYYINDLSGKGFDLIPDPANSGKLKAPGTAGYTAGLQYSFSHRLMASASYSRAQLYDTEGLDGSTYRWGQYIAGNVFYNIWGDLRVGIEYLHGNRTNCNGQTGHANRVVAMLQYSF